MRLGVLSVNLLTVLAGLIHTTAAPAPVIIGNNGDPLKFVFRAARTALAERLAATPTEHLASLRARLPPDAIDWLVDHRDTLLDDVSRSAHNWDAPADARPLGCSPSACACVGLGETGGDIYLNYDACRQLGGDLERISDLLLHEATHHLGVSNEEFASELAEVYGQAWRAYSPARQVGRFAEVSRAQRGDFREPTSAAWDGQRFVVYTPSRLQSGRPHQLRFYDPWLNQWTFSEPTPRSWNEPAAAAQHGGDVALFGTTALVPASDDDVDVGAVYEASRQTWRLTPRDNAPPPTAQTRLMLGTHELFVWGEPWGVDQPAVAVLERDAWRWRTLQLPDFLQRRASPVVAAVERDFFLWGGYSAAAGDVGSPLSDGGIYDAATDRWYRLPPAPFACGGRSQAFWTEQGLLVVGSYCGASQSFGAALYRLEGDYWQDLTADGPRSYAAATWTGSQLLVVDHASLWTYDLLTNRWYRDALTEAFIDGDLAAGPDWLVLTGSYKDSAMQRR